MLTLWSTPLVTVDGENKDIMMTKDSSDMTENLVESASRLTRLTRSASGTE
jgi:hypothetical protein